jgi:hypothetical protein
MHRAVSDLTNSYDGGDLHQSFTVPENEHAEGQVSFEDLLSPTMFRPEENLKFEVDDNITTILQDAETNDLTKHLSKNLRVLIKKVLMRYASKMELKQKALIESAVAAQMNLKATLEPSPVPSSSKKPGTAPKDENESKEAEAGTEHIAVMLQKKILAMQKQIELAEQKSRSATLQWVADKKKYKEVIDLHKQEIVELNAKLSILDRKNRLAEQLNRDGNMMKLDNAAEEEINEIQLLKDSFAQMEEEMTEKRQQLGNLSTELSDTKLELQSNQIKLDYLKEKVDEFTRNEEKLTAQLEKTTKENEENNTRLFHLQNDHDQVCQTLDNEKSNYRNLKESITTMNEHYEIKIDQQKKEINEFQSTIRSLNEQRENTLREHTLKMSRISHENSTLTRENHKLLQAQELLIKSLQTAAKSTQSLSDDLKIHDTKVNKTLEDYVHLTDKLKTQVASVHSHLSTVVESSESKLKELEEKFQAKHKMFLESMEDTNKQMKSLQLSLESREKELFTLQQEHREVKQNLETKQQFISQLESELFDERANALKPISDEEIERIKAEERELWEVKLLETNNLFETEKSRMLNSLEVLQTQLTEVQSDMEKVPVPVVHVYQDQQTQVRENEFEPAEIVNVKPPEPEPMITYDDDPELNLSRIEAILRQALVTNNLYFNKDANAFSNSYPMDEGFLSDLIRTFFNLGRELNGLLNKAKEFQPPQSEITEDAEKFIGMAGQDILIKLEKSKEEVIVKVKNEAKDEMAEKVEATIKRLTDQKQSELFEQREQFESEMNKLKQANEKTTNELLDEIERMKDEFEEELYLAQQEAEKKFQLSSGAGAHGTLHPSGSQSSIQSNSSWQSHNSGGNNNNVSLGINSGDNESLRSSVRIAQPESGNSSLPPLVSRQSSMIGSKRPTMVPSTSTRSNTMRGSTRGIRFTGLESLPPEEVAKLKEQLKPEVEKEFRDQLTEELLGKKKINDSITDSAMNIEIIDLFKSLPSKYQNMTMEQMQQELLTGDLMNIGNVQNENFDRLRNKNFGTDSLIALTILEHHARYEGGDENPPLPMASTSTDTNQSFSIRQSTDTDTQQQRKNRMQMKALEIKRKLLTQQINSEIPILDLFTYLRATEDHLALFSTMNAWKSLLYYQAGGVYRDVLEVHRDVIKKCISEAGGLSAAVQAVSLLPTNTKTGCWPEDFQLKALEIFRQQLYKESLKQQESINGLLAAVSHSVEGSLPQNIEDSMLKNLSVEQRKTFKASRMTLQKEKKMGSSSSFGLQSHASFHSQHSQSTDRTEGSSLKSVAIGSVSQDRQGNSNNSPISVQNPGHSAINTTVPFSIPRALLPSEMAQTAPPEEDEDEFEEPLTGRISENSSSRAPPMAIPMMKRRSEIFKSQKMNTWKMKSERNLTAQSKEDLVQIAEHENILGDDLSNVSMETDLLDPYSKKRTLHGRVDELCIAALRGDDPERDLLSNLLDAFSKWEENHNITANTLFQNSLGFNAHVDNLIAIFMKSSLKNDMPVLMREIYEKIRNILDYLTTRDALDEERDREEKEREKELAEKQDKEGNKSETNSVAMESKQSFSVAEDSTMRTSSGIIIFNESAKAPSVRNKRRSMIPKTTYDMATQTHFVEESAKTEVSVLPQKSDKVLSLIPEGFKLVLFQDDEFEVAPGIFIASAKRLLHLIKQTDPKLNRIKAVNMANNNTSSTVRKNSLLNPFKSVEQLVEELSEVPDNVRYCFGPAVTPMTNSVSEMSNIQLPLPLRKAPSLLELNSIKHCIPVIFPPVYPLQQGLNLIIGFKYNGQGNEYQFSKLTTFEGKNSTRELVTFPKEVILLQIADGLDLPRGTSPLEFSYQVAYDSSLFYTKTKSMETRKTSVVYAADGSVATKEWTQLKLPPQHELVQLVNCCIDFPVGVEVSSGVRIAAVPSNIILPDNIKIVQKSKKTLLPDFMISLKLLEDRNEENVIVDESNTIEIITDEEENTPFAVRLQEGVTIVAKPKDVRFDIGIEMIRRPPGYTLPPGMKLIAKVDYPAGFVLPKGCELVQLQAKYDLPPTCRLTSSWYVYPRPDGVTLKPDHYLVYPDPSLEDHMVPPLPAFACSVAVPNLPYNVKLPNRTVCVELLLSRFTEFPLPEGCILGPGITVLNPKTLYGWQNLTVKCAANVLLVRRAPGTPLPPTIERGSRSDLPSGILLGENMDVVRLIARFELPAGVKVAVGVTLGANVQYAPGTKFLSSVVMSSRSSVHGGTYLGSLTVVEWPYGVTLTPGTELVKKPPSECYLPFEYQQLIVPNKFINGLPDDLIIVKLPRAVKSYTSLQLSEQITVGVESMVNFSRSLPEGIVFASRTDRHSLWPAEMTPVPNAALPPKLWEIVDALNHEAQMDDFQSKAVTGATVVPTASSGPHPGQKLPAPTATTDMRAKQRLNVEVVRLRSVYELPAGVHLHPDVVTVLKPFYMYLPQNVVLVEIKRNPHETLLELLKKGIREVEMNLESLLPMNIHQTFSTTMKYLSSASVPTPQVSVLSLLSDPSLASSSEFAKLLQEFKLNENYYFLQLPDVYDIYSWGENLPGVESVVWNETNSHIALPPGHFLISRPRQSPHDELPCGFSLGISEDYKQLRILTKSLPTHVEIMHMIPSFYLPLGVTIINTSILGRNTFNNRTGNTLMGTPGLSYTKKTFDPFWIPMLSPFEKVSKDAMIIPWPKDLTKHISKIFQQYDSQLFMVPHGIVFLMKNVTRQETDILETIHYPTNIVKHPASDEIINELMKMQANLPQIKALLQFIRKNSVFGKFQNDNVMDETPQNDLKIHQILQVIRISNGFPNLVDRFLPISTKNTSHSADPAHSALAVVKPEDQSLNKTDAVKRKTMILHPKLSRLERIKVTNIQEEIKKFLNDVLIFRFYNLSNTNNPQEYKEKLDYLQFDLMESALWKALNSNTDLEKNCEKILQVNDRLDKENIKIQELLSIKQKQIDEMQIRVNKEEDLKAIISKLREALDRKELENKELRVKQETLEANQLMQYLPPSDVEEVTRRFKQQIDILTSQLADYENKFSQGQPQIPTKELREGQAGAEENINSTIPMPNKDFEIYQKKVDNSLQNLLSLFNSFFMQLISQFDTEIFGKLSADYTMVDLYKDFVSPSNVLQPHAYLGGLSTSESIASLDFVPPQSPVTSVYQVGGSLDDNSSVFTENSLFSKLAPGNKLGQHQKPPMGGLADLSTPSLASSMDMTKDSHTGKKFAITQDFPLDVKSLYHHKADGGNKEFVAFTKPLSMSKSLEVLAKNVKGGLKSRATAQNPLPLDIGHQHQHVQAPQQEQHFIDFGSLSRSIDLYMEAKQKKAQDSEMLFTDSFSVEVLPPPEHEGGGGGMESKSLSYSQPPSPSSNLNNITRRRKSSSTSQLSAFVPPPHQAGLQQQQQPNALKEGEMDLIEWKSELENTLISMNTLFQDTAQMILMNMNRSKFISSQNDDDFSATDSKVRKRLPPRGGQFSESTDVEINWANFQVSLQNNTTKIIQIFRTLIHKYQKNYQKLLFHVENENQLLFKTLKHCKLHMNILKGNYQFSSSKSENNSELIYGYKEKIYSLEKKIDELYSQLLSTDKKPIEELVAKFTEANEMENSSKFLILMLKQSIVKEQHHLSVLQNEFNQNPTHSIHNQISMSPTHPQVNNNFNNFLENEKEMKALQHHIAKMKTSVKDYEERLSSVKNENTHVIQQIMENIEKYHQQIQFCFPSKLLAAFLHKSQFYFDKVHQTSLLSNAGSVAGREEFDRFPSPTRDNRQSNKTVLSPLQGGYESSNQYFSSNQSVGSMTSYNTGSSSVVGGAGGNNSDLLTELSRSLLQQQHPSATHHKGSLKGNPPHSIIGTMPAASSHSQFSNRLKNQENSAHFSKSFESVYRKPKY